ncbi:hypothetical protein PQ469_05880 [Mucilaginibacter sp. KACC 22773]|uniref:hypothetical protein n=1 Tax=Mucilaginibacter sp. KACC 22773 TaxID=3025671 RepID=UPI002364FFF2|nr:hypothetical protein [Mucilaginibacter sp. KACC 22773]WDF79531.1 hypothetical protein PQ469_05880 [Mucilaginibacter sp. KACC 22773]
MAINNFGPFQSDVWGTVSDWITILVYLITAYFIYKTLRSQLAIQRIESNRASREIRPYFSLETRIDENKTGLKLVCHNHTAFDVYTGVNIDASLNPTGDLNLQSKNYFHFIKPGQDSWYTNPMWGNPFVNGCLQINYKDEDGREYEQKIYFSDDYSVKNDLPTVLQG